MIFLLGSGRSGTTFLAKLFDSHPRVLYRHEPDSALLDESIPFHPRLSEIEHYKAGAASYLSRLAKVQTPKVAVHLPLFPKAYRGAVRQRLHNGLALGAKTLAKLPYVEQRIAVPDLIAPAAPKPVTVIKSVNSLNRSRLFLESDPELRVVHIVRHPCGVVASLIRGARQKLMNPEIYFDALYGMEHTEKYGLAREDMEARTFEEQAAFQWMVANDKVLGDMQDMNRYQMVRYEDLCLNTGEVIGELFDFCGLEANPQTYAFTQQLESTEAADASYFSVMRSPKKGVFSWKQELSTEQIERISDIVSRSSVGMEYL